MKQLTQELGSGRMSVLEVPFPIIGDGQILVRNFYSVISAGTEGKTVSDARKGYIAKAKSRQKEVKMVIDMIRSEGIKKTYDLVMNKLDAPSPLGYSCAGEVIAVGRDVKEFKPGDKVACGGAGAYHADIVAINKNLCVKIPENVSIAHAAFSTIASIAIQGIRQADLRLGENCTVIGLGLLGLITVQILKAAGIKTIGVDVNDIQVQKANEINCHLAINRNYEGINKAVSDFTNGFGTDAVIITAATSSNDPVEFAGEICRKKGKVIIVGAVSTGFSRSNYYKKELDLRMSSSYGPGRYDTTYEDKGIDYPIGYVRFTENRNMQTFIDLLRDKRIDMSPLISHTFDLLNAPEAYDLILSKKEQFQGILIKYDQNAELKSSVKILEKNISGESATHIGLIGTGNFAQNSVLPRIKDKLTFVGVVSGEGTTSRYVAEKYGFEYCSDSVEELMSDTRIGTVFILTRHDLHADYAIKALMSGKNVYVEKPIALNYEELENIRSAYIDSGKNLILGFNRRFSPLTEKLIESIDKAFKKSINIRVNAGSAPPEHWVHDPKIGGGRLLGEVCHFIDLAYYIASSKAKSIQAFSLSDNPYLNDTITINLEFENGSIANISYYSNGNKNVPKERIEVFCNGVVYSIDDFKKMMITSDKSTRTIKLRSQDKGHSASFGKVVTSFVTGGESPISFEDIYYSSYLTLEAERSIKERRTIEIGR